VEFGFREQTYLIFEPITATSTTAREFLSHISEMHVPGSTTDLEKLTLFLEAARKLNTTGVLEEILITLIEATLRLTGAERGYVFLRDVDANLQLAAARNSKGQPLLDDKTISRSILEEAATSASEFMVTDTSKSTELAARNSIVAYDLRTVLCIPLRRTQVQEKAASGSAAARPMGVLYLDSHFASRDISAVSHDILRAIATEAAALVENARLVQAEEASKRYQQELSIAASIQQRLMAVKIPDVPYAQVRARNLPCKDIGGDFFDVVNTREGLAVVVADVCGKGISAALLASIHQGMVYTHLVAGVALPEIVGAVNRFLCQKDLGEKYATLVIARVNSEGNLEYLNCGHVAPLLVTDGIVIRTEPTNLPVGLLADASYQSLYHKLKHGDRVMIVTDGITEAEDCSGDFFGNERLEEVIGKARMEDVFAAVRSFCGPVPLNDDCTVLELQYQA
jgi:serine phosphatase RsbU (regulator of sigma subunit)